MNVIQKIAALFSTPVEVQLKDVKGTDGSVDSNGSPVYSLYRITNDLVVGAKCELINEDGTLSIPTTPEITLEDGTVVQIDANGIITEIESPQAEQTEGEMAASTDVAPEDAPADSTPDSEPATEQRIQALEAKVAELVNAVNALIEANNSQAAEMESVKKENEELSKKAAAPAAQFKKFEATTNVEIKTQEESILEKIKNRNK